MSAPARAPARLGLFGRGRLAAAIAEEAREERWRSRFEVAWSLGRGQHPPGPVDVAIDASIAEAVPEHLDWALASSVPLVIGATGWTIEDLVLRVGEQTGVLVAPNFSLGAALLRRIALVLGRFADQSPDRDPWLLEHHHRHKVDAPSGTARLLAETVLEGCSRKREWTLVAGDVADHQLSVSSVRAGAEFGSHTVGVDAPAETIEVRHRARSRRAFAAGALEGACWIRGRRGVYGFDEVVAELLDPLFDMGRRDSGT